MSDYNIKVSIASVADILNLHQRTLRIWDKEGILTPKRTSKNRRYYSLEDIEKGKLILFLTKNLALNLMGVKIVLGLLNDKELDLKEKLEYLNNLTQKLEIDSKIQERNIEKTSKRGRRSIEE